MQLATTQCQVALDRLRANDTSLISDFVGKTADGMSGQALQTLMNEMADVTSETGNTISITKAGSLADAYLQMIKTTEPIVDGEGKVPLPTVYPPELAKKLERELEERGPEFRKEVENARIEKEQQALASEAERLARYDKCECIFY